MTMSYLNLLYEFDKDIRYIMKQVVYYVSRDKEHYSNTYCKYLGP